MKIEATQITFHDLRSHLDQINALYSCIFFDYKDNKIIEYKDFNDLKCALRKFEDKLQGLTKFVPQQLIPLSENETSIIAGGPTIVLLEDDNSIRRLWHKVADRIHVPFISFNSIASLEQSLADLNHNTVFYIDSSLGEEQSGEYYAKKLFERGFENLYLTTGYDTSKFEDCFWLKGVIGKEPPFE